MSLKGNILRVFSANFLNMISGIVIAFVIPMALSVNEYSNLKTYTFYISYITIFTLGFQEGMYIKYGGKNFKDLDKSLLKTEHLAYVILQVLFASLFFIVGILINNKIIIFMAITIIPFNMVGFFRANYQAIGEFKRYTKLIYIQTLTYLILNLLLVFIFKSNNYVYFCLATIVSNILVTICIEFSVYKNFKGIRCKYDKSILKNFKVGFFILMANLSVMLFYGLDRWFIKIFFTVEDFAYYSFALSMLNLINVLVNSISVIFYNYISKNEVEESIKKLKNYLIILGVFSSFLYFGFATVVNLIIKKYIPSLSIISISFSAYPYMIVINALFVNLYKARKDEKKYLKVVTGMLIISFIYNFLAVIISDNPILISVATTLGFITWYLYSAKDFKYLAPNKNEIMFLGINLIVFLITSHLKNWIMGGLIYLLVIIMTVYFFFNDEFNEVAYIIKLKDKLKENELDKIN